MYSLFKIDLTTAYYLCSNILLQFINYGCNLNISPQRHHKTISIIRWFIVGYTPSFLEFVSSWEHFATCRKLPFLPLYHTPSSIILHAIPMHTLQRYRLRSVTSALEVK